MERPKKENIIRANIRTFIEKYATKGRTLEIGCGTSQYAQYFPNRVGLDIRSIPTADLVADVHDLHMVKDGEFDCVLCIEVLEHLHTPQKAIGEMHRVLNKNGILILTTRFLFPLHDVPGDYYRFTRYGLEYLLRDFEIIEMREEADTLGTLAVIFQRIGFQTEAFYPKPLRGMLRQIWVRFWVALSRIVKLFSFIISEEFCEIGQERVRLKSIMTSGYYVACRKVK